MNKVVTVIVIIIFLVPSCTSWKSQMASTGDCNAATNNAIYDFANRRALKDRSNVFFVRILDISENIIGVSIIGDENKLFPTPKNRIGSNESNFPTRYIERNKKLFIWYDSTSNITLELIAILSKYNHLDSVNVNEIVQIPEFIIDDSKKGVDYYFCKENLKKYKKVKTNIAMGWYDPPNLECHSQ